MASEEMWGVWCFAGGGGWVYGSGGPDGKVDNVFEERTAAEKLRGLMEWRDAGTNYEVRPYPSATQPKVACPGCRAAVCDCNDPKAEWGHWWKGTSPEPSFAASLSRAGAVARRKELIDAGYPEMRGPVQRRSDPPWKFEERSLTTVAKIAAEKAAHPMMVLERQPDGTSRVYPESASIDVAALARAIHATDPRVIALVQRRGDKIDAAAVWKAGERGSADEALWLAEAISRACAVAELMGGGK